MYHGAQIEVSWCWPARPLSRAAAYYLTSTTTYAHPCLVVMRPGVPLSLIIERYGWSAYFATLLGACGLALALLAPLSGLSSFAQRQHRHEQEQMQAVAGSGGDGGGRGDGDGVGEAKLA